MRRFRLGTRWSPLGPRWVTLVGVALVAQGAGAAAPAPLAEPLDGAPFRGRLTTVAGGEASFALAGGGSRRVALGGLRRWGEPAPTAGRPVVGLADGSRLITGPTWARQSPLELSAEGCVLRLSSLHPLKCGREELAWVAFEGARDPRRYAAALAEARSHQGTQDRLWLTHGDTVDGAVTAIDRRTVTLGEGDAATPVDASKVVAVAFATSGDHGAPEADMLVGLTDGSLARATGLSVGPLGIEVLRAEGAPLTGPRADVVAMLQPLSGRVLHLSDLTPVTYQHTPYFTGAWPLARDTGLEGGPLVVAGRRAAKGLAMHSAASVAYRIEPGWDRFESTVGIEDAPPGGASAGRGSVVFRVYLAGPEGLRPAWESPVVRGGAQPVGVAVSLKGATGLVLAVDFADHGDALDHAAWLDARLVRGRGE